MQFQKISILPPWKGFDFPGGGGSVESKNLKNCTEVNRNFQRGGGSYENSLSCGRYGHFQELHIDCQWLDSTFEIIQFKSIIVMWR